MPIDRINDEKFQAQLERLSEEAESIRFRFTSRYQGRTFAATGFSILVITACAAGFGWFMLMEAQPIPALLCIAVLITVPLFLHFWAEGVLKNYRKAYKSEFLPKLAKLLGGLKFHPGRGVSRNVIAKTGVIPSHSVYEAEDCFMGKYKGVKVMFSEARLYRDKNKDQQIFEGVFVLLEAPTQKFSGHTIITTHADMVRRYTRKR